MGIRASQGTQLKMDELKPISHNQFNEFIKGKGLKDLKATFGFIPLDRDVALVVSSKDMEPAMFGSMTEATKSYWHWRKGH